MASAFGAADSFRGGQADGELAPLAGAFALGGDAPAVHLDELLDERQADAEPAFGAGHRPVPLGEEVEDAGQQLGRDAHARVPDLDDDVVALAPGREPDAAPGVGILRGVRQEVDEDLLEPQRVGLEPQAAGASETLSSCFRSSMSGRTASTALLTTGERSSGSFRRPIFPRVMRETSSRSSISRARCFTCRWTTSFAQSRSSSVSSFPKSWTALLMDDSGFRSSWASIARNSSFRRSASSRSASMSFCWVMSRPIFEAPMIRPSASRMGETVSETSMIVPSFRRRLVS